MTVKVNSVPKPLYHDLRLRFFEERLNEEKLVPVRREKKLAEVFV